MRQILLCLQSDKLNKLSDGSVQVGITFLLLMHWHFIMKLSVSIFPYIVMLLVIDSYSPLSIPTCSWIPLHDDGWVCPSTSNGRVIANQTIKETFISYWSKSTQQVIKVASYIMKKTDIKLYNLVTNQ